MKQLFYILTVMTLTFCGGLQTNIPELNPRIDTIFLDYQFGMSKEEFDKKTKLLIYSGKIYVKGDNSYYTGDGHLDFDSIVTTTTNCYKLFFNPLNLDSLEFNVFPYFFQDSLYCLKLVSREKVPNFQGYGVARLLQIKFGEEPKNDNFFENRYTRITVKAIDHTIIWSIDTLNLNLSIYKNEITNFINLKPVQPLVIQYLDTELKRKKQELFRMEKVRLDSILVKDL